MQTYIVKDRSNEQELSLTDAKAYLLGRGCTLDARFPDSLEGDYFATDLTMIGVYFYDIAE